MSQHVYKYSGNFKNKAKGGTDFTNSREEETVVHLDSLENLIHRQ